MVKKGKRNESAYLVRAFRSMPAVRHECVVREDGTVDLSGSELIRWAVQNEDVLNYIGHRAMSSPYTKYDKNTGLWEGTDSHLSVEEARSLSDVELYERQAKKNRRTRQGQRQLEDAFEEMKAVEDETGRYFVTVRELSLMMDVCEKTIRRRVEKSPFHYVKNNRVYEK